uniref:Uncharacterized protein n=1 Tax=Oryza glumipatula TaxID=40148 RepID=A0A0D9ZWG3_9ORYZ
MVTPAPPTGWDFSPGDSISDEVWSRFGSPDIDVMADANFTCRRRAANELTAQDAVAGLMALSNGQIQCAGVDKDSNSGDVY